MRSFIVTISLALAVCAALIAYVLWGFPERSRGIFEGESNGQTIRLELFDRHAVVTDQTGTHEQNYGRVFPQLGADGVLYYPFIPGVSFRPVKAAQ